MKDYRLSEIKEICGKEKCGICPFSGIFTKHDIDGQIKRIVFCDYDGEIYMPRDWDIDEPSEQTADDIIAAVKQIIWNNGTFDEMGETVTLDGNDIDHIAEQIAEEILK